MGSYQVPNQGIAICLRKEIIMKIEDLQVLVDALAFIEQKGDLKGFPQMRILNNVLEQNGWWISESTGRIVVDSVQGDAVRNRSGWFKYHQEEAKSWLYKHASQRKSMGGK